MWEILEFKRKHKDFIQHSFLTFLTIQCTIFQVQNSHFQLLSKKEGNLKEMNGFEVEMGVIFDTLNTILSSTICHLIRDSFSEERKTLYLDFYVFSLLFWILKIDASSWELFSTSGTQLHMFFFSIWFRFANSIS